MTNTTNQLLTTISSTSQIPKHQVQKTLSLFDEGATLPFIARYRKEITGGLDETQLRTIQTLYTYHQQLNARKETILTAIAEQNKLTPAIEASVQNCTDKQALEDVYLPFKKSRKTKADVAIANGFLPLANIMLIQQDTRSKAAILSDFSEDALEGAGHIIAQQLSDNANHRQWLRQLIEGTGRLCTKLTTKA